jgi:hypothetical protein
VSLASNMYLQALLSKYAVPTGPASATEQQASRLLPVIRAWAGNALLVLAWTGSYVKGTGVRGPNDIDLFVSLRHDTPMNLRAIYNSLNNHLLGSGFNPRRQNVSLGVDVGGVKVDVVPARKQAPGPSGDHSLYHRRGDTWMQTNPAQHIHYVIQSNRRAEIRLTKIWRNVHSLGFPSFCLELAVIAALSGARGDLTENFVSVLNYLANNIQIVRLVDPANSNNVVSDELTVPEKTAIAQQARSSLQAKIWEAILW